MEIKLQPVATVHNTRTEAKDDYWEEVVSTIELASHLPTQAFNNIELFSHLEIIYYFHHAPSDTIPFERRPRGNAAWPLMGIFGQRNKDRPNSIGLCTVELIGHNERTLTVKYLDAIDGTPVLDIKPVFKQFQPQGETRQPAWVAELTKNYWR